MAEAHRVASPDGGVAQSLEVLAHSGRSHQGDVFPLGQKLQGKGGVQHPVVQPKVIDADQPEGLLETGVFKPEINASVGASVALAADDDFQEGAVAPPLPARGRTTETPL